MRIAFRKHHYMNRTKDKTLQSMGWPHENHRICPDIVRKYHIYVH